MIVDHTKKLMYIPEIECTAGVLANVFFIYIILALTVSKILENVSLSMYIFNNNYFYYSLVRF